MTATTTTTNNNNTEYEEGDWSKTSLSSSDNNHSPSILISSPIPQSILTESSSCETSDDSSSSNSATDHLPENNNNTNTSNNTTNTIVLSTPLPPTNNNNNTTDDDPYADVRARMESLAHRDFTTRSSPTTTTQHNELPPIPFFAALTTYLGYAVLIVIGHARDLCANLFRSGRYRPSTAHQYPSDDGTRYAPLLKSWENFYTRRLYHRIQDCFNRPLASSPGAVISVLERGSSDGMKTMYLLNEEGREGVGEGDMEEFRRGRYFVSVGEEEEEDVMMTTTTTTTTTNEEQPQRRRQRQRIARRCLNLGSYNYLGFADDWNETCEEEVMASLNSLPVSCGSAGMEAGRTSVHDRLERMIAAFLGKESAIVYNMGFNTNATTIPALVGRGDLLISDELNHTSIVNGARGSGAAIRIFRHNDAEQLESILKEAIVMGRPRMRRPFDKIIVIVEGIYSMEGEFCNLKEISAVCRRYGAYLYLDEAHSIGAMGKTGRGISEYCGVPPEGVDIFMGTFSKSFGGMGGYIASSKAVIDRLKSKCAASLYHNSLSPVVCQQVITSLKVISGQDGTNIGKRKLRNLRDNSNYFRMRLNDMGLHVLGNYDSPVMPIMLYNPTKIAAFSRECFKRGIAVVVVGFPAVPILVSRARFCLSAGHTREDLDRALEQIDEVATILKLRYAFSATG